MTKDEEKAEALSAFFDSVFNGKTSCPLGTQCPEKEDRDGEQNEAPIIQGQMVGDLLHHLGTLWSWMGYTEGAAGSAHSATSNHSSAVLASWGGPS